MSSSSVPPPPGAGGHLSSYQPVDTQEDRRSGGSGNNSYDDNSNRQFRNDENEDLPQELRPPTMQGMTGSKVVGPMLLYGVSVFSSLGVWLFGYDQGVMSGIITGPYFKTYFNNLTSPQIGNMVAILEIGAFISSLFAASLADTKGRRRTMLIGAITFCVGGVIQTVTWSYNMMCLGRIVSGFGVGMLSMIVPIYQSEISPAEHRGKLACIEFTGNVVGYASSIWIDYFCSFITSDMSWRIPLSIQCIGGLALAIGSLFIPESPRFLIDTDQDEEGLKVLADFQDGNLDDPVTRAHFAEIKESVLLDRAVGDRSYKALWKRYKGRVLIAMSSQAFAQMNGINVISYYAPLVFEQARWVGRDAILMTGINALCYVAATIIPWFVVDRFGRRMILLSGAALMAAALTATGWWIYIDQAITPNAVVVCVIIFNAAFGYSWGPIPWLYPPEIMPLPFRAKGVSLSTATNWFFNYYVGVTTPVFQDLIGWRLYPMHAGFCALSFVVVYFMYPETAGVSLEEMDVLFGDDEDDKMQDDEEEEENNDNDVDDSSLYTGSGTSISGSLGSSISFRPAQRRASGMPLLQKSRGPVSLVRQMYNNMLGREQGPSATYRSVEEQ